MVEDLAPRPVGQADNLHALTAQDLVEAGRQLGRVGVGAAPTSARVTGPSLPTHQAISHAVTARFVTEFEIVALVALPGSSWRCCEK